MTQSLKTGNLLKHFTLSNLLTLQSAVCVVAYGCHIIKGLVADMIYLATNF